MRRTVISSLALTLILAVLTVPSHARKTAERSLPPTIYSAPSAMADLPPDLQSYSTSSRLMSAVADTFHLAWWGFDNNGAPDAQGWVAVDMQGAIGDFFHVQDATILDGGDFGRLNVLEGSQTMWCGTYAGYSDETCNYATLPGYGNSWDQRLVSKVFAGCDSIQFCFLASWDSEPGYDRTALEWRTTNPPGPWQLIQGTGYYQGWNQGLDCIGVRDPNSAPQIRFRFTSDGAWSDEDAMWPTDGAFLLDSLTVRWFNEVPPASGNWVLSATYFEDFEDETPGDHATTDGCWSSQPPPGFASFGALYNGLTVEQSDPCFLNATSLWGFFDDPMITNYACGGFPAQGAIRHGPDANGLYMQNAVVSPKIPIVGTGDSYLVKFKVYRELPLDALIYWDMDMRTWIAGCPTKWFRGVEAVNYGNQKDWLQVTEEVGHNVNPAASHIQIRLETLDMCATWCGVFGSGACHSHGPLYDNVQVLRVDNAGPLVTVQHINLFQDNFAEDGTLTGTSRADMAQDIAPSASPTILPGDSLCATASGLGIDPYTGLGPAAYCYVAVWPYANPGGKTPADLEAPETRADVGKRYPLVNTTVQGGVTWACFRMDTVRTSGGSVVPNRWCFDLNDNVFTPGDTICYVLCFDDGAGNERYFSRRLNGQGVDFLTDNLGEALASPMEFTILPAKGWIVGTDVLYVDDADDRPGPPQLFFDTAWGLFEGATEASFIDRFDVLGPSSAAGNSLASRVKNAFVQICNCYSVIVWNTGDLASGLIGDGPGGNPEKSDDFALLYDFLDTKGNHPTVFLSGDDLAEEWVTSPNTGAVNLRAIYMNFNLVSGDHVAAGESVSPTVTAVGPCFIHLGVPDKFIAYGGCPAINDFDVLQATGLSTTEFPYPNGSGDAFVMQITPNSNASIAGVSLMGLSFDNIRDITPGFPPVRWHILKEGPRCNSQGPFGQPTGIPTAGSAYLLAASPNPFNPSTTIRYGIRERGHVSLKIYNVAGQVVRTLVNEVKSPRAEGFEATWDARSDGGSQVSTGVYFYKLIAGDFVQTKKMVLLK